MGLDASCDGSAMVGAPLNGAIANELGKLVADFVGMGGTRSRAFISDDDVVFLLGDSATRVSATQSSPAVPILCGSGATSCSAQWRSSSSHQSSGSPDARLACS